MGLWRQWQHSIHFFLCDLMKLIRPFVEESWLLTGSWPLISACMTLAICLPNKTLKQENYYIAKYLLSTVVKWEVNILPDIRTHAIIIKEGYHLVCHGILWINWFYTKSVDALVPSASKSCRYLDVFLGRHCLPLGPRKMAAINQKTFSNAFFEWKCTNSTELRS